MTFAQQAEILRIAKIRRDDAGREFAAALDRADRVESDRLGKLYREACSRVNVEQVRLDAIRRSRFGR